MDYQNLGFHLSWLDDDAISLMKLSASMDGKPIWPVAGDENSDLEVFADDVLSFLAENWHSLFLEQTYPIYTPRRPSKLRLVAEAAWEANESLDAETEDLQIEAFEQTHNLASCFAGLMDIPPLWLMRQGEAMMVDNEKSYWESSFKQVSRVLRELGDSIAQRLSSQEKFSTLLDAWASRANMDPLTLLSTAAGIPLDYAKELVEARILREPHNFADAANDDDELRVAARVTGLLSLEQVSNILSVAKKVPHAQSAALREIKKHVSGEFSGLRHQKAYDIGANVAISAREFLGLRTTHRVDLQKVLLDLDVSLTVADHLTDMFKGLAIWGERHGPGIVVGMSEPGSPCSKAYQRVTIAHELGHLLMDGDDHAVGAVDVLRGRVPPDMERRAKSFAGEFLLPAKAALDAWQQKGHPSDQNNLTELIEALRKKYGVTKSVAAWKLEHGLKSCEVDLSEILDRIAPKR